MPATDLISMFLLGFFGTGHCIGMCGPLVLAIPTARQGTRFHIAYHAGRIATYTATGFLLGLLGDGLMGISGRTGAETLTRMTQIQVIMSGVAAIVLLVFAAVRLGFIAEPRWMAVGSLGGIPGFRGVITRLKARGDMGSTFSFGLMMGFLPCGLTYAAYARALPAGGAIEGASMVAAFALGTAPGLLAIGTAAAPLARRHQRLFEVLAGVLMVGMAASLMVDALRALI